MPDVHATFSPSSAERIINCPPSLRLSEEFPVSESTYAREGTEAHSVCEYMLKTALGEPCAQPAAYSEEMEECAAGYRDEVLSIYDSLHTPFISVEQRVSFSDYVPGAFGTSDCVIIGDKQLYVIDYKHGKGVPVSAEDNAQLKCYALGAYLMFSPLYDIEIIHLVIYQPRISNYSRFTLSSRALLDWAENVLKPAAEKALRGEGEFCSGSWCRFCRAKAICRKRAEENLALQKTLTDDEVNDILGKLDQLVSWANDVKEYALAQALSGHAWKDWKLVEGRSNRKFTDTDAVVKAVEGAGYDPYEKKLLGITAMEKMLGKEKFGELLGGLIEKPAGAPTLVSRSDKRPEMNVLEDIFKEEN